MSDYAIIVENLSKKYILGSAISATFFEIVNNNLMRLLGKKNQCEKEEFMALKNISFKLKKGEILGVIGKNGAGKSTLLKILSKITPPTQGKIEINGKTASLLEVGTGFHPDLTGRENIFLNGSILGLKRNEIKLKFDEIVEFAGVNKFIDTPLKRYSSGMYVRLAFAVAAHLNPDILFIDEVLAVGDIEFQKKCIDKMKNVTGIGKTVLLVSHTMGIIGEISDSVLLLKDGELYMHSNPKDAINKYIELNSEESKSKILNVSAANSCFITGIKIYKNNNQECYLFDIIDQILIETHFTISNNIINYFNVEITLYRDFTPVFTSFSSDNNQYIQSIEAGKYIATLTIPGFFLKAGNYKIDIVLRDESGPKALVYLSDIAKFQVEELSINTRAKGFCKSRPGNVIFPGIWNIKIIH